LELEIAITPLEWKDDEFNALEESYRKELLNEIIIK